MASLPNIITRVNSLTASHRQTVSLIQRLQQFSNPSASSDDGDGHDDLYDPEVRTEIASDIQQALKDQEEELEILRLDVEDILSPATAEPTTPSSRWVGRGDAHVRTRRQDGERDNERERLVAQISRLMEELKAARQSFRRSQLAAKRYADAEKARQRAALFAPPLISTSPSEQQPGQQPDQTPFPRPRSRQTIKETRAQKHLTQDDITLAASQDVTNALRRTHHLLESTLNQSQFAAETLAESSAALSTLSDSYSTLDSILATSKSLVGSLLHSQKSDTWYLETAFYLCATTLAWLVFRRIFYGPLWWLVWLPVKWTWWFTSNLVGGVTPDSLSAASNARYSTGGGTTAPPVAQASPGRSGVPTNDPAHGGWRHVPIPGKGGGWGGPVRPPGEAEAAQEQRQSAKEQSDGAGIIEKIHEMADKVSEQMGGKEYHYVDGDNDDNNESDTEIEVEQSGDEEAYERNTKKRMWEEPPASTAGFVRDEL